MSTRDLGAHIAELHEHGMLAITGEGTRITLAAHETLDLLNWLNQQRSTLLQTVQAEASAIDSPTWPYTTNTPPLDMSDDPEVPMDEP